MKMEKDEIFLKNIANLDKSLLKYINRPIIFDTGPLIFLLSGSVNPNNIGRNPLTKEFTKDEFELLFNFTQLFSKIIVTPNVLTEVSNRINNKVSRAQLQNYMLSLLDGFKSLIEEHIEKDIIIGYNEFTFLGFTDISLIDLAKKNDYLVLTKDLNLERICHSYEIPVLHFDKLRCLAWNK